MTELIRAAGAVLWRPGPEILLVHRPRYDDWSLPKGKQEPGEHILLTAVREVQEETSVRPVLGPRLRSVSYLSRGEAKRVDYWQAQAGSAAADNEIDAVQWLPAEKALTQLTYPHDRDVVAGLVPVETVPLILLRHASAGSKGASASQQGDLLRPLDAKGERDAAALAGLLACFAPRARVISSPAVRCTQTVVPYIEAAGVPLETDLSLKAHSIRTSSGPSPSNPLRTLVARTLVEQTLLAERRPAIVCLHRENLPDALAAACSALGAEPPHDYALHKGSFWVLHAAVTAGDGAGSLVAMERYDSS
jgi:8-oxo-(d)GTP phosphatase